MSVFKDSTPEGPFDRSRVADQIFQDLKDQILVGSLPFGSRLPTEKELVVRYRVSGPTVREAIRGLTATGLVDVRHGSGAYVAAKGETLVAMSLGAAIQLEGIGASEVLSVLAVLNQQAAVLATEAATDQDHENLRAALARLETFETAEEAVAGVRAFHLAVAQASHNPLLSLLCGFLFDVQAELAMELSGGSLAVWKQILTSLKEARHSFADAILRRDRDAAGESARQFHRRSAEVISSLPRANEIKASDPTLRLLLSSMVKRIKAGSNI